MGKVLGDLKTSDGVGVPRENFGNVDALSPVAFDSESFAVDGFPRTGRRNGR